MGGLPGGSDHWRRVLRVHPLASIQVLSALLGEGEDEISQRPVPAMMPDTCCLEGLLLLQKLPVVMFYHCNRKVTYTELHSFSIGSICLKRGFQ